MDTKLDRFALANQALALTQTMLDLATQGLWDQLGNIEQARELIIVTLFSNLESTPGKSAEWIDVLRQIHAANDRLLDLSVLERDRAAGELASLLKGQKAHLAYSDMADTE